LRLLPTRVSTFGKSVLIAAGVGFELLRGLRTLGFVTTDRLESAGVEARMDAINLALSRLGEQNQQLHARLDRAATREELLKAIERVFGRIEAEVDARLERQMRSVEALKLMVGQTDELLQKVLDGLESYPERR
jgi:hypothetical protein